MYVEFYRYEYFNGGYHYNIIDKGFFVTGMNMTIKEIYELNLDLRHNVLSKRDYFMSALDFETETYMSLYSNMFIRLLKTNIKKRL